MYTYGQVMTMRLVMHLSALKIEELGVVAPIHHVLKVILASHLFLERIIYLLHDQRMDFLATPLFAEIERAHPSDHERVACATIAFSVASRFRHGGSTATAISSSGMLMVRIVGSRGRSSTHTRGRHRKDCDWPFQARSSSSVITCRLAG